MQTLEKDYTLYLNCITSVYGGKESARNGIICEIIHSICRDHIDNCFTIFNEQGDILEWLENQIIEHKHNSIKSNLMLVFQDCNDILDKWIKDSTHIADMIVNNKILSISIILSSNDGKLSDFMERFLVIKKILV